MSCFPGRMWKPILLIAGWFNSGISVTANPSVPSSLYTGVAAMADNNCPRGSDSRSSCATATYSGRGQGQQFVLIHRQRILVFGELRIVFAEPPGKMRLQILRRLAESAPRNRRPARAGAVRDHHGKSCVARPRPQRGLAHPRMAHHGNPAPVDVRIGFEIIHRAAQAPRPGAERTPFAWVP